MIFLSSKWVIKQQRQLATSTTHLAQELLTNIQCSGGSRSSAKETRALDEGRGGWLRKLTRTSGKKSSKLILLQLYKKLLKNSVTHSTVIWHLKQIGKTKKLNKWVPHELTENPQNRHFEESSSLILLNNGPFLNQTVMGNKRRVLHDNWQ